jgi:TPP-dependent indolepyruvate ferredoxin oxidoreductase alpha subunit
MTVAEVIARILVAHDIELVTHVPGHGGTQTFDAYNRIAAHKQPMSFHEEVAYSIAHGAALTGTRSACLVKTHGIAKAMNSVLDSLSCGTTAAFITILFEDKTGKHSDNIFEIAPILDGARVPYMITSPESIQEVVPEAIYLSEAMSLPYFIVIDADTIDEEIEEHQLPKRTEPPAYERDIAKHLVTPIFAQYQYETLNMRLKSAPEPEAPMIRTLSESLPPGYLKAVDPYLTIFAEFKRTAQFDFVAGDAGVSTLSAFPPYDIVHAASYMGGSLPLAMGAYLSGMKNSWAFTGDFSFIAAGHFALIEAIERKIPLKILIYANGTAQTTGGQKLDLSHLDRVLKGYEQYVHHIRDAIDPESIRPVLALANESVELTIIVAHFV